jgi:hypothetical protein
MKRVSSFFFGLLLGAVLTFVGLKYHVVRATNGFHLVSKTKAQLNGTYVDIRSFGFKDWEDHPDLAAALLQSGDENLRTAAANSTIDNAISDVLGGIGVKSAANR